MYLKWKNSSKTPTYYVWRSMRSRCLHPSNRSYKHYGGRGIKVCDRWLNNYDAFFEDMGECPKGLSLERIDVNGDYSPENCRWATLKEQANNRRNNTPITFNGETMNAAQWAEKLGIGKDTLYRRLNVYKLPLEIALQSGRLHEWKHGTRHGYEQGCRCVKCKAAHAERHRLRRAKRREKKNQNVS